MRQHIVNLLIAIAFLLPVSCTSLYAGEKAGEKPNIVFIFADDQCHNTINTLGNKEVITPTLDRMVQSGVTFTSAYNMGAWHGAVCVASRTMLNTGRFVWRSRAIERELSKPEAQAQL